MTKSDSGVLQVAFGVLANLVAIYVTKWLDSLEFPTALAGTLQVLIWIIAAIISIRCIDYMIRRLDRWLANKYFRRSRPRHLCLDVKRLSLKSRSLLLYKSDSVDDMVDFYNSRCDGFQRQYENMANIVKQEYDIILPEYENIRSAGTALRHCADALDKISKRQEAKRLIRFLPSNMTIKLKR